MWTAVIENARHEVSCSARKKKVKIKSSTVWFCKLLLVQKGWGQNGWRFTKSSLVSRPHETVHFTLTLPSCATTYEYVKLTILPCTHQAEPGIRTCSVGLSARFPRQQSHNQ
jgi:hypothetical protein